MRGTVLAASDGVRRGMGGGVWSSTSRQQSSTLPPLEDTSNLQPTALCLRPDRQGLQCQGVDTIPEGGCLHKVWPMTRSFRQEPANLATVNTRKRKGETTRGLSDMQTTSAFTMGCASPDRTNHVRDRPSTDISPSGTSGCTPDSCVLIGPNVNDNGCLPETHMHSCLMASCPVNKARRLPKYGLRSRTPHLTCGMDRA